MWSSRRRSVRGRILTPTKNRTRTQTNAITPGPGLTPKGKRNGLELRRETLVSGSAALAAALNASLGKFTPETARRERTAQ